MTLALSHRQVKSRNKGSALKSMNETLHHCSVPLIAQDFDGAGGSCPNCRVGFLQRWTGMHIRSGQIYAAGLARPNAVIRQEGKSSVCAEPAHNLDFPAGLLQGFANERSQGKLTAVDSTAGQLIFRFRLKLVGQQNQAAVRDDRICSLSLPIPDRVANGFIETGYHAMSRAASV